MRRDVVFVTVSIGDTMIATGEADGPFAFDWAPEHLLVPPAAGEPTVRAQIGIADVTLSRGVAPERTLPYPSDLDPRAWRYLAVSLAAHLLMWGAATRARPQDQTIGCELLADTVLVRTRGGAPNLPHDAGSHEDGEASVVSMRLAPQASGETGGGDASVPSRADGAGRDGPVPPISTEALVAALSSDLDFPSNDDAAGSAGPLYGPGADPTSGFGSGRSTFGADGGCAQEPCGTVTTTHYQPLDPSAKIGTSYASGMRDRTGGVICRLPGAQSIVMSGELDKTTIRRYVQRQIERLTYCYETALLGTPDLGGEIALSFTIDPAGRVHGVVASGFSADVDRCVSTVIENIEFPRSPGGGTTQVNYPLFFREAR